MKGPVLLIVLDGFGIGDGGPADATAAAHTPFLSAEGVLRIPPFYTPLNTVHRRVSGHESR